jgi:hypothetical protein
MFGVMGQNYFSLFCTECQLAICSIGRRAIDVAKKAIEDVIG